jgi:hypothetical protein
MISIVVSYCLSINSCGLLFSLHFFNQLGGFFPYIFLAYDGIALHFQYSQRISACIHRKNNWSSFMLPSLRSDFLIRFSLCEQVTILGASCQHLSEIFFCGILTTASTSSSSPREALAFGEVRHICSSLSPFLGGHVLSEHCR